MSAQHNSGRKGWRLARLGEVCEKITDGTHHSPVNGSKGTFKYITAKNIRPWGLDLSDITYIDAATHAEIFSRCDVRIDDVLMVKDGATTGRLALNTLDEPFSLLSSVGVLRPGPELLPKYLLYVLQSPSVKDRLLAQVAGVAITRLTLKKLKESCIPVAPLSEQHRIVAEIEEQLSRLEAGVAALKRVQANLKRYTSSVIASTFPHVSETLPTGWTWSSLSDLGELSRGKSKHRPRDDPKLYGGSYPFIQTGDVKASRGRIREFTQTYSEMGLAQSRLWPAGTLCITIAANIADTGILEFESCFPDSVVGFRADSGLALTQYIERYLRSMKEHLDRLAPATAQKNINLEVLSNIQVPVPPPSIAKSMVEEVDRRLSVVEELEAQVTADFLRAERLKQSILQQAFSATPSSMSRN